MPDQFTDARGRSVREGVNLGKRSMSEDVRTHGRMGEPVAKGDSLVDSMMSRTHSARSSNRSVRRASSVDVFQGAAGISSQRAEEMGQHTYKACSQFKRSLHTAHVIGNDVGSLYKKAPPLDCFIAQVHADITRGNEPTAWSRPGFVFYPRDHKCRKDVLVPSADGLQEKPSAGRRTTKLENAADTLCAQMNAGDHGERYMSKRKIAAGCPQQEGGRAMQSVLRGQDCAPGDWETTFHHYGGGFSAPSGAVAIVERPRQRHRQQHAAPALRHAASVDCGLGSVCYDERFDGTGSVRSGGTSRSVPPPLQSPHRCLRQRSVERERDTHDRIHGRERGSIPGSRCPSARSARSQDRRAPMQHWACPSSFSPSGALSPKRYVASAREGAGLPSHGINFAEAQRSSDDQSLGGGAARSALPRGAEDWTLGSARSGRSSCSSQVSSRMVSARGDPGRQVPKGLAMSASSLSTASPRAEADNWNTQVQPKPPLDARAARAPSPSPMSPALSQARSGNHAGNYSRHERRRTVACPPLGDHRAFSDRPRPASRPMWRV